MQTKMEHPVDMKRLEGIIEFIQAAERLKSTLRSGHTAEGRPESTAEHSWRLSLLVTLFDKNLAIATGCAF